MFKPKFITHPVSLMSREQVPVEFVKSFKRAGYDITEKDLLRCIKDNKTKNLVYYATVALKTQGTFKSINALKSLTSYPKQDVKVCAVISIGAISKAEETEYYASLLDSKFRDKGYLMAVIWEVGDERALNSVKILAGKILHNRVVVTSQSDILYITEYMERFSNLDDTSKIVEQLKSILPKLNPW